MYIHAFETWNTKRWATIQDQYKVLAKVTEGYKLFQEGSWKLSEMFYARSSLVKRDDTFYKRYRKMSKIVQRAEEKWMSALKLNLVSPSAFLHSLKLCGNKKFRWDLCQPPATVLVKTGKQTTTIMPILYLPLFMAIWQLWAARTCFALIIRLACRIIDSRVGTCKEIENKSFFKFDFFNRLGPMPPSGRRTKTGSLGQDTVWGGYILEKNHEKPTWNHEKPWKPTKNHEKPWNYLEKPWKPGRG